MNPYLITALPVGPGVLAKLIRMIPIQSLDRPTHPGRFSPREVLAHLSDWEPILLERMKRTVADPGCLILGVDEEERAREQRYEEKDPLFEADRFAALRFETMEWLSELSDDDWQQSSVHSERGEMSVSDQANLLLGHDLYHIQQLCDALTPSSVGTW